MLLNPLTILLLGQLFITLFVIILYQSFQKKRLLKELATKNQAGNSLTLGADFDRQEVTQLLNELSAGLKPATSKQSEIFAGLAAALSLQLVPLSLIGKDEFNLSSGDLISQEDIDTAIGKPDPLDQLEATLEEPLDKTLNDFDLGLDDELGGLDDFDLGLDDELDELEGMEGLEELEELDDPTLEDEKDLDLGIAELELESLDLEADDDLSEDDLEVDDLDFDEALNFDDLDFDAAELEAGPALVLEEEPEDLQKAIDAAAKDGFVDLEKELK